MSIYSTGNKDFSVDKEYKTDHLPNAQKYNPELVKKAAGYIKQWKTNGEAIPTMEKFCLFLGVSRGSIFSWANKYPEFAEIMEEINLTQAATLINGSLKNELNPTISKLILCKQGYHEKQETDHRSSDGSMSPTRIEIVAISTDTNTE